MERGKKEANQTDGGWIRLVTMRQWDGAFLDFYFIAIVWEVY